MNTIKVLKRLEQLEGRVSKLEYKKCLLQQKLYERIRAEARLDNKDDSEMFTFLRVDDSEEIIESLAKDLLEKRKK